MAPFQNVRRDCTFIMKGFVNSAVRVCRRKNEKSGIREIGIEAYFDEKKNISHYIHYKEKVE